MRLCSLDVESIFVAQALICFEMQEFVALLSEYIHWVAQNPGESKAICDLSQRVWASLKRTAKAGARKTVGAYFIAS